MSSGTKAPTPPPVQAPGRSVPPAEQFIDKRLRQTARQLRWTDLLSSLLVLASAGLGFLLVLSIVDHWLVDLGAFGRWTAFLVLALGSIAYLGLTVAPPLFQRINPAYAARAIEEGTPSLKNSLVSFLDLRRRPAVVHRGVYQHIRTRAAHDLAAVPADISVDRSRLIQIGYLLVALLAAGAVYKVLSPKDPFQTVARVLSPWKSLGRPSRVAILDVQPGDVTIYHGQVVDVNAVVRGPAQHVELLYSTPDGQRVDHAVPMLLDEAGDRFHGTLSAASGQQTLSYRVVAGDAVSDEYQIRVSASPTILVQRLHYRYPDYTQLPPREIESQNAIEAVEGTRVTIHARANHPIGTASIELSRAGTTSGNATLRLPLHVDESAAQRTLTLELDSARRNARFDAYQLAFVTSDGQPSVETVHHRIRVFPDLSPEVAVLTPASFHTEVPLDGEQLIEIRAIDPDYGLRTIRLLGEVGDERIIHQPLFEDQQGWTGQRVARWEFAPREFRLQAGDTVSLWAEVEDNRHNSDGALAPNHSRTSRYELAIVGPSGKPVAGREDSGAGGRPEIPNAEDERGPSAADAEESGPSEAGGNGGEGGAATDQAGGEGAEESESNSSGSGPSETHESSAESQRGEGGSGGAEGGENGEKDTAAGSGGGSSGDSSSTTGDRGDSDSSDQTNDSEGSSGGADGGASPGGGRQSAEPLHDGEAFERALEHMQEKQTSSQGRSTDGSAGSDAGTASERREDGGRQGGGPEDEPDPREKGPSNQATSERTEGGSNSGRGAEANDLPPETEPGAPDGETPQSDQPTGGHRGGDAGAGDMGEKPESGAASDRANRDRQKRRDPAATDTVDRDETQSLSGSDSQSDSEGGASGDHSGGGQSGGGQNANRPGQNSAGNNTAADEGAGAAQEVGQGENSTNAGNQQESSGPTGQTGDKPGAGSAKRPGSGAAGDGGGTSSNQADAPKPEENTSPPNPKQTDPAESPSGQSQKPSSPGSGSTGMGGGPSQGGGRPGESQQPGRVADGAPRAGDKANLDYARKTTNLVLDYLQDQADEPDPELLDKLGWSAAELREFLARWERLKQTAREGSGGAREMDERLRGLGLRPEKDRLRSRNVAEQRMGGLRQGGRVTPPPPDYREQFDAFRKSRSRIGAGR